MTTKEVFTFPNAKSIDGLNLSTNKYKIVFEKRLDDYRLKAGDNTLIATYPRTGTTWLCQIVSLLLAREGKYDETKTISMFERVPYLECKADGSDDSNIQRLHTFPTPRAVKTHLPYRFIRRWIDEDKVKTIITTRNPKDTLVSLFHLYLGYNGFSFNGSWDDFFKLVQVGKVLYGDQYEWYKDWEDNKDKGQLLFIKYEDMKQDLLREVKRIMSFLDLQVPDKQVQQVVQDSGIKQMKADLKDASNFKSDTFVRKGQNGEWKKYFTVEQNEWFDSKYKKLYEGLSIGVRYE